MKLHKLNHANLNITNLLQVEIGDGEETSFWDDKWHELGILKTAFPRLYALKADKGIKSKHRLNKNLDNWERRRAIRDGRERAEATSWKKLLEDKTL